METQRHSTNLIYIYWSLLQQKFDLQDYYLSRSNQFTTYKLLISIILKLLFK